MSKSVKGPKKLDNRENAPAKAKPPKNKKHPKGKKK